MMIQAETFTENHRFARYLLMLEAEVSIGGEAFGCVIFGLSAGGAKVRLRGAEGLSERYLSEPVDLHIPRFGGFEGEIIWKDDEFVGIKFNENHKTIVNLILAKATQDAP